MESARVVSATNVDRSLVHELSLLTTASYQPQNTSATYMQEFYRTLGDIKHEAFDGMVITGAPVERMPFEAVSYWAELRDILEWARRRVFRRR